MEYRIVGTVMPVLEILLGANESIVAEPGELKAYWEIIAAEILLNYSRNLQRTGGPD